MTAWISAVGPGAELAYFVAGVLLLGGLLLGLRQLRLIKEDAAVRASRAAKEKAIEACDAYGEFIVRSNKAYSFQTERNIESYKGEVGDFTMKSLKSMGRLRDEELARLSIHSLNKLEVIAAYFITGVADEITGFRIIGRTFCASVENNYDYLSFGRNSDAHNYWDNIVDLYKLWRPRLKDAEIVVAIKRLESERNFIGGQQPS